MNNYLLSMLSERRSIRKYKNKEVEQEKINKIIQAALLSPSSHANYPWQFIVVNDINLLSRLSLSKMHGSAFLSNAPLGIVVTADQNLSDVWIEDASISSTFIMITAHALGLGSCWIQIRKRMHSETKTAEEYIREILKIPENVNVLSIIALGYPDEEKIPKRENELLYERVFYNTYAKIPNK
ncbi:MAG TPA: NAD(P)H-dependent dehydrogenase/reductase [Candidatus Atribacteria bacterium]|nr:NAD(P)H-dependent dehydrogenase/reductase [Candidatus Atribacteria bacterium]